MLIALGKELKRSGGRGAPVSGPWFGSANPATIGVMDRPSFDVVAGSGRRFIAWLAAAPKG